MATLRLHLVLVLGVLRLDHVTRELLCVALPFSPHHQTSPEIRRNSNNETSAPRLVYKYGQLVSQQL